MAQRPGAPSPAIRRDEVVDGLLAFIADPRDVKKRRVAQSYVAAVAPPVQRLRYPDVPQELLDALVLEGSASQSDVEALVDVIVSHQALHPAGFRRGSHAVPDESPSPTPCRISRREAEVLRLVAAGLTNSQIAAALCLSPHTVKRHLGNVFAKAGLTTRAHAAAFALRSGIV